MIVMILLMLALWACGAAFNYLGIDLILKSFKWVGGSAIGGSALGVFLVLLGIATIIVAVLAVSAIKTNKKE